MVKFILYPFAALLLLGSVIKHNPQNNAALKKETAQNIQRTPLKEKAFAQKIFAALRAGDAKAWINLYPNEKEYALLLTKAAALEVQGASLASVWELVAQRQKEAAAAYTKEFAGLRQAGAAAGVDWKAVAFGDFIFDTDSTATNLRYLNGDVWMKVGKAEFVMKGIEAVETPAGYRLQSVAGIEKVDYDE